MISESASRGPHTLRTKIALAFLGVMFVALLALVLLYTRSTRQALLGEANQTLYAAALRTATSVDAFLSTNLSTVRAEALLPEISEFVSLSPTEQTVALQETSILEVLNTLRRKDLFHIESYGILNQAGRNIADTSLPYIGQDESETDYFRRSMETGLPYLSPVRFAERVGGVYFHFSAPIRNDVGVIIGVLRVRYSVGFLQQLVTQVRGSAGQGSFAVLLDENGLRLAHDTAPDLVFKTVIPLDPEIAEVLRDAGRLPNLPLEALSTDVPDLYSGLLASDKQPFFVADAHDGTTPLEALAVVRLENHPWYVVFAQSQETFLRPINRAVRVTVILAVLVAVLVTALAFWVVNWLTRPVIHLTAVAEQIARGNLDVEANVESADEVGHLARTFNLMTVQLRENLDGLRHTNEHLRQEIIERRRIEEERRVLLEEEQRQRILAETLREVTLALTSQIGFESVLEEILNQAQRIVPYRTAHIALLERDMLRPVRWSGYDQNDAEAYIRTVIHNISQLPIDMEAIGTRAPVLIDDTLAEPRWQIFEATAWIRSYLVLPICLQDRVLGVLRFHGDTPGFFASEHIQRSLPLVSAAAIAIEKAALVEGLESEVAARTAEIRAEQEKSETLLRSIADAIIMMDDEMCVRYSNPAYSRLTGFTAAEVMGQSLMSLTQGTAGLWGAIETTLHQGRNWEGEITALRKDGAIYDAAATIAPVFDATGKRVGSVVSHHDISPRKRFERARQQFLNNVSHELRTPVTTLQLYLQLLRRQPDSERAADYLQRAGVVTEQLLQLVQHFLDVAALETEPGVTDWRPIDLSRLIEELIAYRQGRAAAQVAPFQVMPLPLELPAIKGDPERLTHALKEILDNALSFTPPEGQVRFEVKPAIQGTQSGVVLLMSDTGPGIILEERERIFDLFFRGSAASAMPLPGIGLGLSIAQRIIQGHGGQITLESAPGKGSTFAIWLPAA